LPLPPAHSAGMGRYCPPHRRSSRETPTMATAREVKPGPNWEYLEVTDELGGHWRYGRKGRAEGAPAPVIAVKDGTPRLLTERSGRPLLRQDEEGLPETIIVRLDHAVPEPIVGEAGTSGGGEFEFELIG